MMSFGIVLLVAVAGVVDDGPPPALTVTLERPDRQVDRALDWFRGAKAPHAAAALAGWKRATGRSLPKAIEALIAAGNPDLARELATLDRARVVLGVDPASHAVRWRGLVPEDDGTFAAVATALALTDGGPVAPIGDLPVDRIVPEGAPLMAVDGRKVALASDRDELRRAFAADAEPGLSAESGRLRFRFDPSACGGLASLTARQALAFLAALEGGALVGEAMVDGPAFRASWSGAIPAGAAGFWSARVDPTWFDDLPADRTMAAAALAIDPQPASWAVLFDAVDRALKVDPTQLNAPPIRTRVNVLALPLGIVPEAQLWPKLRGVTVGLLGTSAKVEGVRVVLRAVDPAAAERLETTVIPKLAARLGLSRLDGRALKVARRGDRVVLAWDDRDDDGAGPRVSAVVGGIGTPHHAVVAWPGRIPGLDPTAADGLAATGLIVWTGSVDGGMLRDQLAWGRIDAGVRRFLDLLPMDLPPETRR